MKLDTIYIKKLLLSIESSKIARPYLGEIIQIMGMKDIDNEFLLHYEVLFDYGFIEAPWINEGIGGAKGIIDVDGDDITWMDVPLRLTGKGHEFIMALEKVEVWEVIKSEFKESSIKTIFKVACGLVEGLAKKKVEGILEI